MLLYTLTRACTTQIQTNNNALPVIADLFMIHITGNMVGMKLPVEPVSVQFGLNNHQDPQLGPPN